MSLRFFDCDCAIGRLAIPQPGSFDTVAELLAEMDYFGIERSLVYHNLARDYDPMAGNRKLLAELTGQPRLAPCWVVLPHHTGQVPEPENLIAEMRRSGVRAARVFPARKGHHWSLSAWSAGPLFAALAAERVPVFVHFDQIGGWDALYRVAAAHPDLPLVVNGVRYEELRHLYPLLEALHNLHIDIAWTVVHYGLEDLVARFGAERFLFGTRMPLFTAGPALTHLLYADLDERAKALIASGNLERLLAGSMSAPDPQPVAATEGRQSRG